MSHARRHRRRLASTDLANRIEIEADHENRGRSRDMRGQHGDLIAVLDRWQSAGGLWRVLTRSEAWVTVGLFSCDGGEQMSLVTGRAVDLDPYLACRSECDLGPSPDRHEAVRSTSAQ